jgi:hypothetical protein
VCGHFPVRTLCKQGGRERTLCKQGGRELPRPGESNQIRGRRAGGGRCSSCACSVHCCGAIRERIDLVLKDVRLKPQPRCLPLSLCLFWGDERESGGRSGRSSGIDLVFMHVCVMPQQSCRGCMGGGVSGGKCGS